MFEDRLLSASVTRFAGISLVNVLNRTGPRMFLCRTPTLIGLMSDVSLFILTAKFRSSRNVNRIAVMYAGIVNRKRLYFTASQPNFVNAWATSKLYMVVYCLFS